MVIEISNFFHVSTMIKRKKNKIEYLMDAEIQWINDIDELKNVGVNYFK